MNGFWKRLVKSAAIFVFPTLIAGCSYPKAVLQNLSWGFPGLVSGGFAGFTEWIAGALANAAAFGVQ